MFKPHSEFCAQPRSPLAPASTGDLIGPFDFDEPSHENDNGRAAVSWSASILFAPPLNMWYYGIG
jgi:hypothetical protein